MLVKNILYIRKPLVKIIFFIVIISLSLFNASYSAERSGFNINAKIAAGYDDNPLCKPEISNVNSERFITLAPEMTFNRLFGKHKLALSHQYNKTKFSDHSELDYSKNKSSAALYLDHTIKFSSEFYVNYYNDTEDPCRTNSANLLINEFTEFTFKQLKSKFNYGREDSIGMLSLALESTDISYSNNTQSYRDHDYQKVTSTFLYRIAPKTRLLIEASISDYDYSDIENLNAVTTYNQSSKQQAYLAGVKWDTTTKTSGTIKVGYINKEFDDENFNDLSDLSYIVDTKWTPNTYTKVTLTGSRITTESSLITSSAYISESIALGITHHVTPSTKANVTFSHSKDDVIETRQASTPLNRVDKYHQYKINLSQQLSTKFKLVLSYLYENKDSDFERYEHNKSIAQISITTLFK